MSYNYISNDTFLAADSLVKNVSGIFFPNNLCVETFFRTPVKRQYESILTQIKQSGFEADKMDFPKNGVRVYYFNSKMYGYQVVVSEYRLAIKGNKKFRNLYEFSVLKNIKK